MVAHSRKKTVWSHAFHRFHRKNPDSATWLARGIEWMMVLISLFWALEANATRQTGSQNPAPAAVNSDQNSGGKKSLKLGRYPSSAKARVPMGNAIESSSFTRTDLRDILGERKRFGSYSTTVNDRSLSNTFQSNPLYSPPTVEVFRFPSSYIKN